MRLKIECGLWRVPLKWDYLYKISEQEEVEIQLQDLVYLFGSTFHRSFSSDLAPLLGVILNLHAYPADMVDVFKAVETGNPVSNAHVLRVIRGV